MTAARRAIRERLLEVLLWFGVILCGILVLVPAAAEYLEAHRVEAADRSLDEAQHPRIAEQERTLDWIVHDPLTDPRLSETPVGTARREVPPGPVPDPDPAAHE